MFEFKEFAGVVDEEMKRLPRMGVGSKTRHVLTKEEEEQLWNYGVLCDKNPKQLLNTAFLMIGIFALGNGEEHRQLRVGKCSQSL